MRRVAFGAVLGLVIALAFTLSMPTRYVATAPLSAPPHAPLYGGVKPPSGPATVEQKSPRTVRDALLGLIAGGLVSGAIVTVRRR